MDRRDIWETMSQEKLQVIEQAVWPRPLPSSRRGQGELVTSDFVKLVNSRQLDQPRTQSLWPNQRLACTVDSWYPNPPLCPTEHRICGG